MADKNKMSDQELGKLLEEKIAGEEATELTAMTAGTMAQPDVGDPELDAQIARKIKQEEVVAGGPEGYRARVRENDLKQEFEEINGPTQDVRKIETDEDWKGAYSQIMQMEEQTGRKIPEAWQPQFGKYWGTPNMDSITETDEMNSGLSKVMRAYVDTKESTTRRLKGLGLDDNNAKLVSGLVYAPGDAVLGSAAGLLENFGMPLSENALDATTKLATKYGGIALEFAAMTGAFKVARFGVSRLLPRLAARAVPAFERSIMSKAGKETAAVIAKNVSKINTLKEVARVSAEMGAFSAMWGTGEALAEGKWEDIPRKAAQGALVGAIAGPGFLFAAKGLARIAAPVLKKAIGLLYKPPDYGEYKALSKVYNESVGNMYQARKGFTQVMRGEKALPEVKQNMARAILAPEKIIKTKGANPMTYSEVAEALKKAPEATESIVDGLASGVEISRVRTALKGLVKTGKGVPVMRGAAKNQEKVRQQIQKEMQPMLDKLLQSDLTAKGINVNSPAFATKKATGVGRIFRGWFLNSTEELGRLDVAMGTNTSAAPMELLQGMGMQETIKRGLAERAGTISKNVIPALERDIQKYAKGITPNLEPKVAARFTQKLASMQGQLKSLQNITQNAEKYTLESLGKEAQSVGLGGKDGAKKIFEYMHYVDSTPEGVKWVTDPLVIKGKYNIPEFIKTGLAEPSAGQKQFLGKLRRFFDMTQTQVGEAGYLPRYIPYKLKTGLVSGKGVGGKVIGSALQRVSGMRQMAQETDVWRLVNRQLNDASSASTTVPLIKKYSAVSSTLRNMGRKDWAGYLDDVMRRVTGQTKTDAQEFLLDDWMKMGEPYFKEQLSLLEKRLDPGTVDKIWTGAREVMAHSIFGTRLRLNVLQRLQPRLVASAEMGPKVIEQAERMFSSAGKLKKAYAAYDPMLREVENTALGKTFSVLETLGETKLTGKTRKIVKALSAAGVPLKENFIRGDVLNRKKVHLAGLFHFNEHAPKIATKGGSVLLPPALAEGLTFPQRRMVEDVLAKDLKKTGDIAYDAGSKLYATIRNLRANYMYHPVDMPSLFAGGAHQLIPFTTWSRNMFARLVTDVQYGHTRTLANRLIYPMAYLNTLRVMTGVEVPGGHPLTSPLGLGGMGLVPLLKVGGDIIWDPGKAAWKTVDLLAPPVKMTRQLGKSFGREALPEGLQGVAKVAGIGKKGKGIEPWGIRYQKPKERFTWKGFKTGLKWK